jgi:hypothetical protein
MVNFLAIRYMTPEGETMLNHYGFTLDHNVFEDKMKEPAVQDYLVKNRMFRNSILLLKEHFESHQPFNGPADVLWLTPGISTVGVAALWALGFFTPDDISKAVIRAETSTPTIDLLELTRRLYRSAVKKMDLTPDEQRMVWAGIMMALCYWRYAVPGQVIGPSTGLKP